MAHSSVVWKVLHSQINIAMKGETMAEERVRKCGHTCLMKLWFIWLLRA